MANAARTAAYVGLGCSNALANSLSTQQGYTNVEDFATLDDSGVEALCKVVRRPGEGIQARHVTQWIRLV